ncbi:ABC transporter permease [Streptomyces gobiensis]|uniref:ABC transporter permease n=1 Tax=Streptomyces gobiensis TaxID=2875706 RepID=UPI001E483ED9|nr:ABC transporter permease [Streptomyces gobiensis]UGY94154.1 ABC transporter permease [Streptomyces gobiensis]
MSARGEVVVYTARRLRRGALIWAAVLAALVATTVSTWTGFRDSQTDTVTADLPDSMKKAFGITDLTDPAGFMDSNLFSLLLPLLLICVAVSWTNSLTTADEDAGRLEMELAQPVTRTMVLLRRFATAVALQIALGVAVLVVLLPSMAGLDLDVPMGRVVAATGAVVLLGVVHGAVLYAAAGLGAQRGTALGLAAGVAVFGYVAHALLPLSDALESVRVISPWQWLLGDGPVQEGVPVAGTAVSLAVVALLITVGTVAANRRDIRGA